MQSKIFICLLLFAGTLALYWPVRHFDFLFYDDAYFVDNPNVLAGLNWHTVKWAMTGIVFKDWHPVTLLSFLLTHQLFGVNQGAEHLVNVEFHAANTVLLFLFLLRSTGATWRSAIVAAFFAWHPLRVESVCWVAERKDVLFMFFMLLSLLCYVDYAQRRREAQGGLGLWNLPYILALVFFVLSFMSKGMVATLPFLLLLLDVWPLQRFSLASIRPLVLEKIPFFMLTVFFSGLTFWIHKKYGDMWPLNYLGMTWRLENAVWSYLMYLAQFFSPTNLAVVYPYPKSFDPVQVTLAGLALLAITGLCVLELSRRPYLAVGWFWYLGTIFPVIGLFQFGQSAMGDRFTYVPLIGPLISLVWLVSEWAQGDVLRKYTTVSLAGVVLAVFIILTRGQIVVWQNTVTLFRHAIEVTSENPFAHLPLGRGLQEYGQWRQEAVQYRMALAEDPGYQHAVEYYRLGGVLIHFGQYGEGLKDYETATQLSPDWPDLMNSLAWSLATCPDASLRDGARAVRLAQQVCEKTNDREANMLSTLAAAYAETGQYDQAIATAQKAIVVARDCNQPDWVQLNQEWLKCYVAHRPYHAAMSQTN
jgi:tetratricopeptide (TPR) repeat protein